MACALFSDETTVCSICLDQYKDPRKLPSCDHSFCALCILKHFSGLQDRDIDVLECPLCRSNIVPPSDDFRVTEKWIQTLPKAMGVLSKIRWNKTTSVSGDSNVDENETANMCAICKELGKTSVSISYCVECQEKLCETCKNIHRVSKLSKNHTVLNVENTSEGEAYSDDFFKLLSKYTHCTEHEGNLYEFYCKEDSVFLCLTCYLFHVKHCKNILEIEQLCARQEYSRRSIVSLKDETLNLSRYATQITDMLKTIKGYQQKESAAIDARLQTIRTTIVKVIDSLEDRVKSQHRTILKQDQLKRSELTDKLCCIKDKLRMKVSMIEKLLKVGSSCQLFVACHRMAHELKEDEKLIIEGCKSYETNVCKISESHVLSELMSMILNDTENLAEVTSQECSPDFPKYKDLSWYNAEKVETITVMGRHDHRYGPLYTCLLYLTNNTILLIDSRHGLCYLIDEHFEIKATRNFMPDESEEVDFERMPSSATVLSSGEIAISVPEEKKIYLVDSETLTKLAHVNTKYKARAIHGLSNGDIAVAWDEPVAFGVISSQMTISQWQLPDRLRVREKVYFTKDKNGRSLDHFDSMAVDNWRSCVIQTSKEDSAVYCFDFEGNPKFCYKNQDLHHPNGLAIDKQGFIYICEEEVSCIHVLNADGNLMQIIKEGCPKSPLAIGIDPERQRFAVSNSGFGFAGRDISFFRILPMQIV